MNSNRRTILRTGAAALGATAMGATITSVDVIRVAAETPARLGGSGGIRVLHPRGRVPLSFIIDDSTCLVNMGHFCMPQFAQAWPDREVYRQPWRDWPREIPDAFVREFGQWCSEHGVKGKYSIVPYPACVGWMDRSLPGWSKQELNDSLKLVRDLMVPNWDIHPEMITHTRVIDLKTGRPMADANAGTMENSYPQSDVSVDHLASYLAYALRILKNCGLPCEGITTPGGFGNRVKAKLPIAVHQAVRDVFGTELPHYFKYVRTGSQSTQPALEYVGEKTVQNLTMNVPAGTGDWFGGWEGSKVSQPDRYCTPDAMSGRMVELIERGEPAVMLCHWPGMYCNGTKAGFEAFKQVVLSMAARFGDTTLWMKVSEIGRYWAAKQWTTLNQGNDNSIELDAPLACESFTFEIDSPQLPGNPVLVSGADAAPLDEAKSLSGLDRGDYWIGKDRCVFCIDLPKGQSRVEFR